VLAEVFPTAGIGRDSDGGGEVCKDDPIDLDSPLSEADVAGLLILTQV